DPGEAGRVPARDHQGHGLSPRAARAAVGQPEREDPRNRRQQLPDRLHHHDDAGLLQAELCLAEPGGRRWAHGRRQMDLVLLLRPERRADHRALEALLAQDRHEWARSYALILASVAWSNAFSQAREL